MEKQITPLKIVLTGPESSGKTTLSVLLADALQTQVVPEFARTYLAYLGRNYVYEDLPSVLRGQLAWETWFASTCSKPWLVCDTDWTVIRVWEWYKYQNVLWTRNLQVESNVHYFLCAPDFTWQEDPLREHSEERDALFGYYLELLRSEAAAFTVLTGTPEKRLKTALSEIQKMY